MVSDENLEKVTNINPIIKVPVRLMVICFALSLMSFIHSQTAITVINKVMSDQVNDEVKNSAIKNPMTNKIAVIILVLSIIWLFFGGYWLVKLISL